MKWEYQTIGVSSMSLSIWDTLNKSLTAMGRNGWELVSVDNGIAYFKRPIESKHIEDVHYWPAPDIRLKNESP